ncbi:DNA-nicking endonuclease, Smr domain [Nitrosomonas marina]|uniref:DNA-nicking endonuclease, Smr domain n=1 Tax=Nitrosomonas marina TaxID=917 RepID=A0A1I0E0K3_9PROT|nr:Smr/MutS family protein [Nitrosomonas marina]SET37822.1 DNA-nicking endonuclease, Smr domain [Nitrosomonas marina]
MSKKKEAAKAINDDITEFYEAMKHVVPLTASDRTILEPEKPAPHPRKKNPFILYDPAFETANANDANLPEISADDEWSYSGPGVSHQTLRRLKRGYWRICDSIDLHRLTQDVAKHRMTDFLNAALQKHLRCVRVIHGKGLSSQDGIPVLKYSVGNWLAQHPAVLAFCQASPENGGGGAVMILLKSKEHKQ